MALSQVTDEFIAHIRAAGPRVGPRAGHRVPRRRRHPARPQGGPAAAGGRGRGRGGPRAARGARPAVRPAAAVPRVQGGRPAGWPRGWPTSPRDTRARSGWRSGTRACCRRCCSGSARTSSPRWPPGRSLPSRCPEVSLGPRPRTAGERAGAGRAAWSSGCGGCGPARSGPSSRTAPTPCTWWPGSWPCSSCTGRRRSPSSRSAPLGELHVRWTGSEDGELEVEDEFEDQASAEEDGETPAAPTGCRERPGGNPGMDDMTSEVGDPATPADGPGAPGGAWPLAEPIAAPSLRAAIEAILLVVDEPVDEVTLASVLERPQAEVAEQLQELAAEYTRDQGAASTCARSPAAGGSTPAPECAARRRAVRARRPAGPAHPGGAGDAGRGGLPPAGHPGPDLRGPRGQRRRRDPDAAPRGAWSRRPAPSTSPARSCTARPATSWSGSGSVRSRSCPRWRPTFPNWTR